MMGRGVEYKLWTKATALREVIEESREQGIHMRYVRVIAYKIVIIRPL